MLLLLLHVLLPFAVAAGARLAARAEGLVASQADVAKALSAFKTAHPGTKANLVAYDCALGQFTAPAQRARWGGQYI